MTSDESGLVRAAARVARSAPEGWKQLLEALDVYTRSQASNCIRSPIDTLPVAQGRAQNAARLQELFSDCLSMSDKLEEKKR